MTIASECSPFAFNQRLGRFGKFGKGRFVNNDLSTMVRDSLLLGVALGILAFVVLRFLIL